MTLERLPSLLRGTAVVGILTLVSRILGLIRELIVARILGASIFADAFFVAFRIPNLLRSFVAEGAFTSAFVPLFADAATAGQQRARTVFSRVLGLLIIATAALTVSGIFFAPQIVALFAPGLRSDFGAFSLCVELTRIMMPYIMCISFVAMSGAALNAFHLYGSAALAQVVMNVVLIAGGIAALNMDRGTATLILAWSVLAGGLIQVFQQLIPLKRKKLLGAPQFKGERTLVKNLGALMLPAILGASVYQVTIFLSTLFASLIGTGAVSWLNYADRVTQFPMGVFSLALGNVLLPILARANADSNAQSFEKSLIDSLRFTSFVILPVSAMIFVFAYPFSALLFEGGAFTPRDTDMTARAVQALALGLWAASLHSLLVRSLIAKKDTVTPTKIGALNILVFMTVALCTIGSDAIPWIGSFFELGHVGLALASSIASIVSCLTAAIVVSRRGYLTTWGPVVRSSIHALAGSLGAAIVVEWICRAHGTSLLILLIAGSAALAVYVLIAALFGSRELWDIVRAARRRLGIGHQSN